jgi:crotonobetainyl-CoA:carnitine CoA-transferase CaiB-like acyl-CoA transferase
LEHNLVLSPIRELAEVLETPHLIRRGFFRECQVVQQAVVSPAAPFRVHASRAPDAADLTPSLLEVPEPRREKTGADKAAPLRGIRILDLGWVWSAPWVGTLLGELGAQVIKVEHAGRPDNLRLAGRVMKDGEVVEGPSREMSPMFHQVNHGKLGITLNLKKPKAVELLKRLVETSDIVVENMSPGSLERSGLGYETLRAVNPRIVMLAMSVAGQFGELATMRAYAPTMSSFVGLEALVGYPSEDPIGALNFAVSDPGASIHALIPLFAALRRAAATGEGCYIDFSQIEALLNTLRPYLLDSQVHRRQPATNGNAHPVHAPHGIYPALEDDSWLALSVVGDEQWNALAERFPEQPWAREGRFATRSDRVTHRDQIDRAIAAWSATMPRDALVETLRGLGIAATPVLSVEEQWRDPHYAARNLRATVELPFYGDEVLVKAPWRFSDCEPRITRCGPTTGEHNEFVFGELLGLSAHEIAALQAAEVIA